MKLIRFIKNIIKYQRLTDAEKQRGDRIYTLVMAQKGE
jgi:hypothetical protein